MPRKFKRLTVELVRLVPQQCRLVVLIPDDTKEDDVEFFLNCLYDQHGGTRQLAGR